MLEPGAVAPDFELVDHQGQHVRLRDFRGRRVVLYFYPKDGTPGCTREACSFRDVHQELQRAGVVVLGVSPDSPQSHARFRERHGLPFPLLSDPEGKVAQAYGAWAQKTLYGRKRWGVARTTFLIGADGKVEQVWRRVRPDGHGQEVLTALQEGAGGKP
ncbi:MAG: thioredoxin-dependent thiol peroxidase [Armatimonadota bacterium]|nr:thioredoxin-dependent thiol peroxidase [Armatimonadota bacterium]MDW8157167.1 thioredoxin-dependent thiol peroxidase [Armatimonadota bacterium]